MVCNYLVDSDLINDIIEDETKRKEKTSVYVYLRSDYLSCYLYKNDVIPVKQIVFTI